MILTATKMQDCLFLCSHGLLQHFYSTGTIILLTKNVGKTYGVEEFSLILP